MKQRGHDFLRGWRLEKDKTTGGVSAACVTIAVAFAGMLAQGAWASAISDAKDGPTGHEHAAAMAPAGHRDDNAAVHYLTAGLYYSKDVRSDMRAMEQGATRDKWTDHDKFRKWVPRTGSDAIAEIMRASTIVRCDFAIHYDLGPEALLPHLGAMRTYARMLALDARVLLDEGDIHEAITRLAAGYKMAGHVAQDRLVISALVSVSIFTTIDNMTAYFDKRGALDDDSKRTLLTAINSANEDDPFAVEASVAFEGAMMTGWLRDRAQTPEGVQEIREILSTQNRTPAARSAAIERALASGGLLNTYITLFDRSYHDAAGVWNAPNPAEAVSAIKDRLHQGVYGPLVESLMPDVMRIYAQDKRARDKLRKRIAALGGDSEVIR